ncbi:uncharacterized protein LOC126901033 [Daktulosphaira vitifoliae]|uniref:uncharacterized protein LOC126901033 n=1 Tax=Daktulosphaira vitifoliae TaxID=58002 RepID=UPI0021AA07DA|nr:uncharacterized protein LOC126901033 [Daktulosphaira vitifoliae]
MNYIGTCDKQSLVSLLGSCDETEINQGECRLRVKPLDALFNEKIKEESIDDCISQTIIELKNEDINEEENKKEIFVDKREPPKAIAINNKQQKVAIPKLKRINSFINESIKKSKVKNTYKLRSSKPRAILPMKHSTISAKVSKLDQTPNSGQILMPSPQMSGIAYQIILKNHETTNANNQLQYTMLQPQSLFLQQTPNSATSSSSVMINQSSQSMVINQPYQVTQTTAQIPVPNKIVAQNYCTFCYCVVNNMNDHLIECWANPNSKNYKFRKIAPSKS